MESFGEYKQSFYERNKEAIIFYSIAVPVFLLGIVPWLIGWYYILT